MSIAFEIQTDNLIGLVLTNANGLILGKIVDTVTFDTGYSAYPAVVLDSGKIIPIADLDLDFEDA